MEIPIYISCALTSGEATHGKTTLECKQSMIVGARWIGQTTSEIVETFDIL